MTPSKPDIPTVAEPESPNVSARDTDVFRNIIDLSQQTTSRSQYMAQLLHEAGRYFQSPYAAIHVRYSSEVIQDDWHSGPSDPAFWKAHLQDFLTDSLAESRSRAKLLKARNSTAHVAYLSAPIHDPTGPAIGAVAVVVTNASKIDLSNALVKLEAICRFGSFCAEFLGKTAGEFAQQGGPDRSVARGAVFATPHELAFALTNELRNKLGCELVALSMVRHGHVEVLSISGLDQVVKRSPGVTRLRQAMEECLDAGATVSYPVCRDAEEGGQSLNYRLHIKWQQHGHGEAVASIPLRAGDGIVAILSLRRDSEGCYSDEELESVRSQIEPFAPALVLTGKAARGLPRHAWDNVRSTWWALTTPGHYARKLAAVLLVAAATWFVFGTTNYHVDVPVVVAPANTRQLTMPLDGILAQAHVVEGDFVRKGDVLCSLDTHALRQRHQELSAERAVNQRHYDQALAERKPVEGKLAAAKLDLVQARIALLNEQLQRTVIRAPFDGVVVEGDLRQLVGAALRRGEKLLRIAPPGRWRLDLEIPQRAVADVSAPLHGVFASYARPEQTQPFEIERLLPSASHRRDQLVYVAEATVDSAQDWMRPGMEGTARVFVGRRRVWWVALHRAVDYVRINFWL